MAGSRTFGEAIQTAFGNYATFSGRASRSEFWWFALFYFLVMWGSAFLGVALLGNRAAPAARSASAAADDAPRLDVIDGSDHGAADQLRDPGTGRDAAPPDRLPVTVGDNPRRVLGTHAAHGLLAATTAEVLDLFG